MYNVLLQTPHSVDPGITDGIREARTRMSNQPISLDNYRIEKELDPIIGRMDPGDLAAILALGFQCWIEDMDDLRGLPEEVRKPLMCAVRSGFVFGVGKVTHLVETQRRFGGSASWTEVCEELDEMIPGPDELSASIGDAS